MRKVAAHDKDVVFIGVNSNDNDGNARKFLAEEPVPYKHFKDPDLEIASEFHGVQAFPTTAFYDTQGRARLRARRSLHVRERPHGGHRPIRSRIWK